MKNKTYILTGFIGLFALTFIGLSNNWILSPVSTNAQQNPQFSFDEINTMAQQNNDTPTYLESEKLADAVFDSLSVVEVPNSVKDSLSNEVANAYLNGTSTINENNIVSAVNNLAIQSSAPAYASTNAEQVKVVRKNLNRLMPDLVKSNGNMSDLEAYAVFIATASQKISNDSFMVTPTEFSNGLNNLPAGEFPGSTEFDNSEAVIIENTTKMDEMETVVSQYAGSKNLASTTSVISSIGIN